MLYIVSLKLSCEPDLYNLDVKKQPVDIDNELVYVGNTSFKIRSNLFVSQVRCYNRFSGYYSLFLMFIHNRTVQSVVSG